MKALRSPGRREKAKLGAPRDKIKNIKPAFKSEAANMKIQTLLGGERD